MFQRSGNYAMNSQDKDALRQAAIRLLTWTRPSGHIACSAAGKLPLF